jgi:hypothetical protein
MGNCGCAIAYLNCYLAEREQSWEMARVSIKDLLEFRCSVIELAEFPQVRGDVNFFERDLARISGNSGLEVLQGRDPVAAAMGLPHQVQRWLSFGVHSRILPVVRHYCA